MIQYVCIAKNILSFHLLCPFIFLYWFHTRALSSLTTKWPKISS